MGTEKKDKEDLERKIKLIHTLAERLPWIAVIVVFFATILIIIEAILTKSS